MAAYCENHNKEKTEIEAKFICPDRIVFDDLLAIISALGFRYCREAPYLQKDVYLDTPEYKLLVSDVALRIRQRGESCVGAYKLSQKREDAVFERREFEWLLAGDEIRRWHDEKKPAIPAAVMDNLNLHGQTLRSVLVVETQRCTAIIGSNEGFKAELSLDDVTFRGHRGQRRYREIELELLVGQSEQIKKVAHELKSHLKLQTAIDSKYKKGMLLVGKHGIEILAVHHNP